VSWGAYWGCTNGWSYDNLFTTVDDYWNAVDEYRGADAEYGICGGTKNGSIAAWFLKKYSNGPIKNYPTMWNFKEETPGGTPSEPPPGSPWRPEITIPDYIPHEVNIVRVGEASGVGIHEANWLLYSGPAAGFTTGQFRLSRSQLTNSQRKYYWRDFDWSNGSWAWNSDVVGCSWDYESWSYIPPIGLVIFTHSYGANVDGITRSAAAEWHYKHGYENFSYIADLLYYY
jgi:hypothetical protein